MSRRSPDTLVVTQPVDAHADRVMEELDRRRRTVLRFDLASFPGSSVLSAELSTPGQWQTCLAADSDEYDLSGVRSVYYRRPQQFGVRSDLTGLARDFAVAESRRGFGGLLRASRARWLNHPDQLARAAYKRHQLSAAAALGFLVPRSLITNSPDRARAFVRDVGDVIYKSFSGQPTHMLNGVPQVIFTTTVDADTDSFDLVAEMPCLFQERIPKEYELRITVVDRDIFAARIDSQESERTSADWRRDPHTVGWRPVTLPTAVASRCLRLVRHFGLTFGTIDIVVTPHDDHVFLEINPNGQWLWLDGEDARIGRSIAHYLSEDGP